MALSGYFLRFSVNATLMNSNPSKLPFRSSISSSSKVGFKGHTGVGSTSWFCGDTKCYRSQSFGITGDNELITESVRKEAEGFLPNAMNMSFFDRLNLAWKILFPSSATRSKSNAKIAKQRLKMILFSDRCAVTDEAKQKIVSNVMDTLSDFVEIDSQDKVQLSVSTDLDLGTIYSITVPVKRVKPEYLDEEDLEDLTNIQYKGT
ncbi:unnamed protein product [Dovyalis caffra]|uniref:Plastid division regulator MinE n=1 Tax=Dovyalis caffra TaxID=77055 RepID=A0AAV1QQD0_9ROSI|nr:unnamed protein product [Dovyalis caffra]